MAIHVTFRNPSHPEYGTVEIAFPIPREQYGQTIEKLEALGLGDVLAGGCTIEQLHSEKPADHQCRLLTGTPDEQVWLKEHLEILSAKETILLPVALKQMPPQTAADVIHCLLSLSDYGICSPAKDEEALGAFYLEYKTSLSSTHPFVDLKELGRQYAALHPGAFFAGCYVEYPTEEIHPLYDGSNFPQRYQEGWSVKLKLSSASVPEGVWLRLPDYEDINDGKPDEIRIALDTLRAETVQECTLLEAECCLPQITALTEQYDNLQELIYDGQSLGLVLEENRRETPYFIERLLAALEYEKCNQLAEALEISQNLNHYDFITSDMLSELATIELHRAGISDKLIQSGCFDIEEYAISLLEERGYACVRGMYVYRNIPPQEIVKSPVWH
ncbi:MAG: hypothetical protein HFG20_11530 [Anaerotruncus sp.]|nr:hypothetical protein [Anaerotruncus sp.]